MGDRKFYIAEVPNWPTIVTEEELKRRLDKMGCLAMDEQIDILLHGTEQPKLLPWRERVVSFQVNPESATNEDIMKMAEKLVEVWGKR